MKTLTGSGRPRNPDDPLDPNFNPNEEPSYPEAEPDDEPRSKSHRPLRRLQCFDVGRMGNWPPTKRPVPLLFNFQLSAVYGVTIPIENLMLL